MANENFKSDQNTCLNFIRRTREELQNNKPVLAYNMLEKVEEYVLKMGGQK